ncbi:hypothetical protein H5410_060818 [Solanum commersonii]|uniref:Uncharacterized protein n=1 Tax=Solanum commersonii TaxID=4109 RepID=A0A9J5W757_SOLCO|nr:hypothetical protein H5410_060818 [Solanum commersonii]
MPQMVDKDKGKSKKFANPKKKFKVNAMRRPAGVVISDEPSRVNISKRASISTTHSTHQSHNASTHVVSQSGYTISTPTVVPSSGYQTLQGYSHLGHGSIKPSVSVSQYNSLNTSSGSIGLSNLHPEPNTPTTHHSDAHGPQPGDRGNFRGLVIEPLGYNHLNNKYLVIFLLHKYYVWAPEHEDDVQVNFKLKASKLLSSTFCDCRRENRVPKFMLPDRWALLLKHWSTDEKFKKRSKIGKMARPLEKEKELGRPVVVPDMFKVTHVKKSTNPTEEERWIEPRALETYLRTPFKLIFFFFSLIGIYKYLRNIVVLYLLRVKTDHLHKKKTRIFGNRVLVNRLEVQSTAIQKRRIRRRSLGIVPKERKRENKEKEERGGDCDGKGGNILPPCPASSDGSDHEGDENDKSDKESEGDENGKSVKESEGDGE